MSLRCAALLVSWICVSLAGANAHALQDPPVELVVKDAEKELVAIETAAAKLRAGDRTTGQQLVRRLDLVARKLGSARDRSTALWKDLAARHAALGKTIVAKANASAGPTLDPAAVTALDSEVSVATSELRALAPERLGDPDVVRLWRERIAAFRERHAALAAIAPEDRRVTAIGAAVSALDQSVTRGMASTASAERTRAFDLRLQELLATYQKAALPQELDRELGPEAVEAWARAVRAFLEKKLPADLAEIEVIAQSPDAPKQRVESARHWIGNQAPIELAQRLELAGDMLDLMLYGAQRDAAFVLAIDPQNPHDVANKLLGEGRFETNQERLRDGVRVVESTRAFLRATDRQAAPTVDEIAATIARAEEHLRASALAALDSVRMPAARSTDPQLLEAIASTLKDPAYAIAGWERLVINLAPKRKESWESTVHPGTVTTRINTVHYVWDELQVTTAEKVGAELHLFYNRLKFFHSAGSTTPTGRWILSERFRSTRILPENLER